MNTDRRIDSLRVLIFVAIIFIYLNVFENNAYSSPDYSVTSPQINIEAIYQPEIPEKYQFDKGSFSIKQKKISTPYYLENIHKYRKKLLLSENNNGFINNPSILPLSFHHIISILQKNNTWHQSSEDDSFLTPYI